MFIVHIYLYTLWIPAIRHITENWNDSEWEDHWTIIIGILVEHVWNLRKLLHCWCSFHTLYGHIVSAGKPPLSQSTPASSSMCLSVCLIFVGQTRVSFGVGLRYILNILKSGHVISRISMRHDLLTLSLCDIPLPSGNLT